MANMSYCRFHNTLADLKDCLQAIDDGARISTDELKKAEKMFQLIGGWLTDIGAVEDFDLKRVMEYTKEQAGQDDEE